MSQGWGVANEQPKIRLPIQGRPQLADEPPRRVSARTWGEGRFTAAITNQCLRSSAVRGPTAKGRTVGHWDDPRGPGELDEV